MDVEAVMSDVVSTLLGALPVAALVVIFCVGAATVLDALNVVMTVRC